MKITASSRFHTVHPDGRFSPAEMAEHFHKIGFEGFDYDMNQYSDLFAHDVREKMMFDLANTAARLGLSVNMCHLPFYKKGDERMRDIELNHRLIKEGIDGAAILGVKNGVIHPQPLIMKKEEYDSEECFTKTIEYLTPIAEYAEKKGIRLAVENMCNFKFDEGYHRFCSFPEELARVADHFGVGVCWDFGHANSVHLAQGDSLRFLGKRITALHVNDNNAKKDDHLLPFFGNIDWHDAMQGLRDSEYDGCFNYECKMIAIPLDIREEIGEYAVALARRLLTY